METWLVAFGCIGAFITVVFIICFVAFAVMERKDRKQLELINLIKRIVKEENSDPEEGDAE